MFSFGFGTGTYRKYAQLDYCIGNILLVGLGIFICNIEKTKAISLNKYLIFTFNF